MKKTIIIFSALFGLISCGGNDLDRTDVIKLIAVKDKLNLRGVDLGGVDLSKLDLSGANLKEANLKGADLTGVDSTHVEL